MVSPQEQRAAANAPSSIARSKATDCTERLARAKPLVEATALALAYSKLQPYGKLREQTEANPEYPKPSDTNDPIVWHERMIEIEDPVRGEWVEPNSWIQRVVVWLWPFPRRGQDKTLQTGCDLEWKGLLITKSLFVVVIALLIYSRT